MKKFDISWFITRSDFNEVTGQYDLREKYFSCFWEYVKDLNQVVALNKEDHYFRGSLRSDYNFGKIVGISFYETNGKIYCKTNCNIPVGRIIASSLFTGVTTKDLEESLKDLEEKWDDLLIKLGKISAEEDIISKLLEDCKKENE